MKKNTGNKIYSALVDDLEHCIVTGSNQVAMHHIFNGNPYRSLSDKYGFIVPLRPDWHNMTPYSVHMNQEFDENLKRWAQRHYESHIGSRSQFIEEFGKSYL